MMVSLSLSLRGVVGEDESLVSNGSFSGSGERRRQR